MGKKVRKAVRRTVGGAISKGTMGLLDGEKLVGGVLGGAGKAVNPKVPQPDDPSEAPKPEEVEESVDERRKRLSILRRGLPQNTLDFFARNPNTRKKTLLGG